MYMKKVCSFRADFFDILALTTVICLEIAKWGRHMVLEQARISGEHSRVKPENPPLRELPLGKETSYHEFSKYSNIHGALGCHFLPDLFLLYLDW